MRWLKNVRTFESLQLRDYRLLWLGQITTAMAQQMDQISRTWLVYSLTKSPFQLGLVSALRGIPLLLFGIAAGVVADRYGRKRQLIIAQVVNGILNFGLATLILTGRIQVWHLYVTSLIAGTVQAFQQPARQVLISDLVGQKHLLNAISLNSAASNLSKSVGPSIAGIIIAAFGVDVSYYVQAVIYLLATMWTGQIRVPESSAVGSYSKGSLSQSFLSSIKEGFAYVGSHRMILALLTLGLAPIFLGSPYISLMPIFAIDILHGDARTQGLLLSSVGVGAVAGALTIASLGRRQGSGKLLILGAAGFGLSLVFFSRSPVLSMALIFASLAGFSNTSYNSQEQTILQTLTPIEIRGRVMSLRLLDRGVQPLGTLLAGTLASVMGGPWAVTIMGISCVLVVLGIVIFVPDIWKSELMPIAERQGRNTG